MDTEKATLRIVALPFVLTLTGSTYMQARAALRT